MPRNKCIVYQDYSYINSSRDEGGCNEAMLWI